MSIRVLLIRIACVILFWEMSVLQTAAAGQDAAKQQSSGRVMDLLQRRCVECHAGESPEGHLDLESLQMRFGISCTIVYWHFDISRIRYLSFGDASCEGRFTGFLE